MDTLRLLRHGADHKKTPQKNPEETGVKKQRYAVAMSGKMIAESGRGRPCPSDGRSRSVFHVAIRYSILKHAISDLCCDLCRCKSRSIWDLFTL